MHTYKLQEYIICEQHVIHICSNFIKTFFFQEGIPLTDL